MNACIVCTHSFGTHLEMLYFLTIHMHQYKETWSLGIEGQIFSFIKSCNHITQWISAAIHGKPYFCSPDSHKYSSVTSSRPSNSPWGIHSVSSSSWAAAPCPPHRTHPSPRHPPCLTHPAEFPWSPATPRRGRLVSMAGECPVAFGGSHVFVCVCMSLSLSLLVGYSFLNRHT